jgi:hypothetical protein
VVAAVEVVAQVAQMVHQVVQAQVDQVALAEVVVRVVLVDQVVRVVLADQVVQLVQVVLADQVVQLVQVDQADQVVRVYLYLVQPIDWLNLPVRLRLVIHRLYTKVDLHFWVWVYHQV